MNNPANEREEPAGDMTAGETEIANMPPEQPFELQETLARIRECRLAGRFEEAQNYCRQILSHDPDNSEAHLLMCALFIEGGEYQEATSWYRKIDRLKSVSDDRKYATMVEKVFKDKQPPRLIEEPAPDDPEQESIRVFAWEEPDPLPDASVPPLREENAVPPAAEPALVSRLQEEPAVPPPAEPIFVPLLREKPAAPPPAEPAFVPPLPEEHVELPSAEPAFVPPPREEVAAIPPAEPVYMSPPRRRTAFSLPEEMPPAPPRNNERASRPYGWIAGIAILVLFLAMLTGWQVYAWLSSRPHAGTHRSTSTESRTGKGQQAVSKNQDETPPPAKQSTLTPTVVTRYITQPGGRTFWPSPAGGLTNSSSASLLTKPGENIGAVPVVQLPIQDPPIATQPVTYRASLQVSSTPAGAAVFLDGRDTGRQTPCTLEVELGQTNTGSAKVALELPGFLRQERTVTVDADKPAEVKLSLSRAPYKVDVNSTPGGGNIYLDGRDTGHQTPYTLTIDAGDGPTREVTLAVELLGYARTERKMTLGNGNDTSISLSLGAPLKVPVANPPAPIPAFPSGTRAREIHKNPRDGAAMVWVPAGEFLMGSANTDELASDHEMPQRRVTLDGYWIYQYEVTVAQFRAYTADSGYAYDWNARKPTWGWNDKHPMVNVTWREARAYADWAGVRLPTEAQWEKAARGTDGRIYPWGKSWSATICNTSENGLRRTMPVGSYPAGASPYGAQDMAGNAGEWCLDWFDLYSKTASTRNPTGPATGKWRILRGGSWRYSADGVRCASRDYGSTSFYWLNAGFRCAAVP